jgi:hypothetical protein
MQWPTRCYDWLAGSMFEEMDVNCGCVCVSSCWIMQMEDLTSIITEQGVEVKMAHWIGGPLSFLTRSIQYRIYGRRHLPNPRGGLGSMLFVVFLLIPSSYSFRCEDNALQANQHHQQGIRLLSSGLFGEAVVEFEAALRVSPDPIRPSWFVDFWRDDWTNAQAATPRPVKGGFSIPTRM